MAKYFIDKEIYWQGKKQVPRKVIIHNITYCDDNKNVICYDDEGDCYILPITDIFDDEND